MQESSNHHPTLAEALRAVATDDAHLAPSPADVEARLLREVRAIRSARRRRYVAVTAIAAALVFAVGVSLSRTSWRHASDRSAVPGSPVMAEIATAFFPLTYSSLPMSGGHIVRLDVPEEALARFGLASPVSFEHMTSRMVVADVLVGDDGLARAVRFVRPIAH
jgi:hypothetical protein